MRDAIVTDLYSFMYYDKEAISGNSMPEKTCLHSVNVPLHYLLAGHLLFDLPEDFFWLEDKRHFGHVFGAPNNPDIPFPNDKEIRENCFSHSDFDLYTIANNLDYIKQIQRWKKFVLYWPKPEMTGLEAQILKAPIWCPPHSPRYPLETLPEATLDHVDINRRKSYLKFASLMNSPPYPEFKFLIESEFPKDEDGSFSRTFKCSLSKETISSLKAMEIPENFVLKVFDDYRAKLPEGDYPTGRITPRYWARQFTTSYEHLYNERRAYLRLKHVWGSTVPWFYGAFMVRIVCLVKDR